MGANVSRRIAACCLVVLVGAAPASAAVATFTNRALWQAAAGPTSLQNFNSYVTEIPFHTVPLDAGAFTISMTGTPNTDPERNSIDLPPPQFSQFSVDGTNIANVLTGFGDSLFLTFDSPISAFGADLAAFNDGNLRTRIVVGNDVMTPTVTVGDQTRFFGFIADTLFTAVEFRAVDNDGYGMDNVAFGRVPEPTCLALMGLGVVGIGQVVCRGRRSVR